MSEAGRYHAVRALVDRGSGLVRGIAGALRQAARSDRARWLRARTADWREREAGRTALWCAPAMGVGALAYFEAPVDPPPFAAIVALGVVAATWRALRSRIGAAWRPAAAMLVAALSGSAAAEIRILSVSAPVLAFETRPTDVSGRLVSRVREAGGGAAYLIAVDAVAGLPDDRTPERVRVRWRGAEGAAEPEPGEAMIIRAVLLPPPGPVAPGAFDYARQIWFQRIGATGYALGPPSRVGAPEPPTLAARIERLRERIADHVAARTAGDASGVLVAMTTGIRGSVSERAETALRDSGLAHLLAISGLHVGLVAGIVFAAVRFGLAAVPDLAVRLPLKKLAALAAASATLAYLAISGGAWSARRAAVMTLVALIAILVDRRAISLRNVALAAFVILATTPEAVLHAGFHMSFAATTALVAAYEARPRLGRAGRDAGVLDRALAYALGLTATSVVAGLATGPFAAFHFNRAAVYGLLGNLAAMPLVGLAVAPATLFGALLSPLGLDGPAFAAASAAMNRVIDIADAIASAPGAVRHLATPPAWALCAVIFGGLLVCLLRAPWRIGGLAAIGLGLAGPALAPPPPAAAVFVSRTGENAAVAIDGRIAVWRVRRETFATSSIARRAGLAGDPSAVAPMDEVGACDDLGCVLEVATTAGPVRVAVADRIDGLAEDCARADLVVALAYVPRETLDRCAAELVHRGTVRETGAVLATIDRSGAIAISGARRRPYARPWSGG